MIKVNISIIVCGVAAMLIGICSLIACTPSSERQSAPSEVNIAESLQNSQDGRLGTRMNAYAPDINFQDFLSLFQTMPLPLSLDERFLFDANIDSMLRIPAKYRDLIDCGELKNALSSGKEIYPVARVFLFDTLYSVLILKADGAGGRAQDLSLLFFANDGTMVNCIRLAHLYADCGFENIQTAVLQSDATVKSEKIMRELNCQTEQVVNEQRDSVEYHIDMRGRVVLDSH